MEFQIHHKKYTQPDRTQLTGRDILGLAQEFTIGDISKDFNVYVTFAGLRNAVIVDSGNSIEILEGMVFTIQPKNDPLKNTYIRKGRQ